MGKTNIYKYKIIGTTYTGIDLSTIPGPHPQISNILVLQSHLFMASKITFIVSEYNVVVANGPIDVDPRDDNTASFPENSASKVSIWYASPLTIFKFSCL